MGRAAAAIRMSRPCLRQGQKIMALLLLALNALIVLPLPVHSFASTTTTTTTTTTTHHDRCHYCASVQQPMLVASDNSRGPSRRRSRLWRLLDSPRNEDNDDSSKTTSNKDDDQEDEKESSILSRFTSPRLDDPFLPLSDAMVAQIIAPSLQIAWLSLNRAAPSPTWLQPIFGKAQLLGNGAGSLLAPTLIHGAALATCWIIGALAARAYEIDAIAVDPVTKSYGTVIQRVVQAGCFATGLLILSTQFDLYTEFGGYVQLGDSPETDFRIQVALVEGFNDVLSEAITLLAWRLYLAYQSSKRL